MMKKFMCLALVFVLCTGMFAGCGANYAADESTVFVLKDGGIVSTDVEEFDESAYDEDGLKTYAKETIDDYNTANGEGRVKLKDLSVKDKKATIILSYASAMDYQKFNGIELFAGSVAEALAAGYDFDGEFATVTDEGGVMLCDADAYLNDAEYKVVVIRGNLNVHVPGNIVCFSVENTKYVDAKTIGVRTGTSALDTEAGTESTEAASETVGQEASTQMQEAEESVSDDDLLNMSTEASEEVYFQFNDENAKENSSAGEFSQVYTYIIYK